MFIAGKDHYLDVLLSLIPPGQIVRNRDSNLGKQLRPAAAELARIDARARGLIEEADPRTTLELFEDWEAFAGLPDPCSPADLTLGERRDALIRKLLSEGGQSRPYFKSIAEDLGFTVEITEFRPMGFGRWGFGYHVVSDDHGSYIIGPQTPFNNHELYWIVYVYGTSFTRFAFGRSAFPDPMLKIRTAEQLECILQRLKPAHTNLTFIYIEDEEEE
jgi:uncharacterized protein YmfQ (DUF2313 family)